MGESGDSICDLQGGTLSIYSFYGSVNIGNGSSYASINLSKNRVSTARQDASGLGLESLARRCRGVRARLCYRRWRVRRGEFR